MSACKPCQLRELLSPLDNEKWGSERWAEEAQELFVETLRRSETESEILCNACDQFWTKFIDSKVGDRHPIASVDIVPGELLVLQSLAMAGRLHGRSPVGPTVGKGQPEKTDRARVSPDAVKKLRPGEWLGSPKLKERCRACIGRDDPLTCYLYEVTSMGSQAWSAWWGPSNLVCSSTNAPIANQAEAIGMGSVPATVADYCAFLNWTDLAKEVSQKGWKYFGKYWKERKGERAPSTVNMLSIVFATYAGRLGTGDIMAKRLPLPYSLGSRVFEVGGYMNSSASRKGLRWEVAISNSMLYDWVELAHDAASGEINVWCLAHQAEVLDIDQVDILSTAYASAEIDEDMDDALTGVTIWCAVTSRYAFFESRRLGFRSPGTYGIKIDPAGNVEKIDSNLFKQRKDKLAQHDSIYMNLCRGRMTAYEAREEAAEVLDMLLETGDSRHPKAIELRDWVLFHMGGLCEHCQPSPETQDPTAGLIRDLCYISHSLFK